jgi:quercetin dioxygenase-like cupin family protein
MIKYQSVPHQLVEGLSSRNMTHDPGKQIDFHYHDAEEWLEVLKGKITFFPAGALTSAGEPSYSVVTGQALKIPRGEIHRVEVGPEGVTYQMWVPIYDEFSSNILDEEEISLVRRNLQLPDIENRWQARNPDSLTSVDEKDREFLNDFLSMDLIFRTGSGHLIEGKLAFLDRQPDDIIRKPSASIRILHKSPESVYLYSVVHTQSKDGNNRKSFSNYRLFVKEENMWKCRLWINYPEFGVV